VNHSSNDLIAGLSDKIAVPNYGELPRGTSLVRIPLIPRELPSHPKPSSEWPSTVSATNNGVNLDNATGSSKKAILESKYVAIFRHTYTVRPTVDIS
jgi:hypothetical protein